MNPVVIALIGAAAAFLIYVALAWRSGKDADADPEAEHRAAAAAIIESRYQAEEEQAASEGDLPHLHGGEDGLGIEGGDGAYAEEGRAKVIPDAGTIVGDLPETRAPTRVGWRRDAGPATVGEAQAHVVMDRVEEIAARRS